MYLHQIKDTIREHFGRTGLSTTLVDLALQEGRLLIEKEANFWWMESEVDFSLIVDQQEYLIGPDSPEIDIPNFKDAQFLSFKKTTDNDWAPVTVGQQEKSELDLMYSTDDPGEPESAIVKGQTLIIYPPLPDQDYDMRLYYYGYTPMPTSNLSEPSDDELINNWGLALIYSALIWGYEIKLLDIQGASYWRTLLLGPQGELPKLKRLNFKRGWKSQVDFIPKVGPGVSSLRRISNMQLYPRR